MKKSLLFIIPSLGGGGAEKSLITLLKLLDYDRYCVDLMLFRREGFFLEQVPPQVTIMDGGEDYRYFDGGLKQALVYFLKNRKYHLAFDRLNYSFALKKRGTANRSAYVWRYLSRALPDIKKTYDVSVGYLEGNSIYFCVDKTNSAKKLGYIHSEYEKLGMDEVFDEHYLTQLTHVVTVSNSCAESLIKAIPPVRNKTVVIENIISQEEIRSLALSEPAFEDSFDGIRLLTVGRISCEKGIDMAVDACAILLLKGYRIRWYVAGSGDLTGDIQALIKTKGLENHFILLGSQKNPYKYMARCDIYIQPSRYEGKSLAIEEAKVLAKPVVTTNFTTVHDQIEDTVTGLIAQADPPSLAEKIGLLIDSPEMRDTLSHNLKSWCCDDKNELNRFYALVNE